MTVHLSHEVPVTEADTITIEELVAAVHRLEEDTNSLSERQTWLQNLALIHVTIDRNYTGRGWVIRASLTAEIDWNT